MASKSAEEKINFTVKRAQLAPPGIPGEFGVVAQTDDGIDDQKKLFDSEIREFGFAALLSKGTPFLEDLNFSPDVEFGSSYLESAHEQIKLKFPNGSFFEVFLNSKKQLSKITLNTSARNKEEAFSNFYKVVGPYLDFLSFKANVPLGIQKIICTDKKNNVSNFKYSTPYQTMALSPGGASIPAAIMPILAIYREAKNSVSPFYRLFCYLKILEGMRHVRSQTHAMAKSAKVEIKRTKDLVPNDPELGVFGHEKYIGKPVHKLFEDVLQKEFRNALAHFSLNDEAPWNLTDHQTQSKVMNHLLLAELCCRASIESELNALHQLAVSGVKV